MTYDDTIYNYYGLRELINNEQYAHISWDGAN